MYQFVFYFMVIFFFKERSYDFRLKTNVTHHFSQLGEHFHASIPLFQQLC